MVPSTIIPLTAITVASPRPPIPLARPRSSCVESSADARRSVWNANPGPSGRSSARLPGARELALSVSARRLDDEDRESAERCEWTDLGRKRFAVGERKAELTGAPLLAFECVVLMLEVEGWRVCERRRETLGAVGRGGMSDRKCAAVPADEDSRKYGARRAGEGSGEALSVGCRRGRLRTEGVDGVRSDCRSSCWGLVSKRTLDRTASIPTLPA